MKPRRTEFTHIVFRLPGGNEDNDLWAYKMDGENGPVICSVWEPSEEERGAIAAGANVRLCVFGESHPPVAIDLTNERLGKRSE